MDKNILEKAIIKTLMKSTRTINDINKKLSGEIKKDPSIDRLKKAIEIAKTIIESLKIANTISDKLILSINQEKLSEEEISIVEQLKN